MYWTTILFYNNELKLLNGASEQRTDDKSTCNAQLCRAGTTKQEQGRHATKKKKKVAAPKRKYNAGKTSQQHEEEFAAAFGGASMDTTVLH